VNAVPLIFGVRKCYTTGNETRHKQAAGGNLRKGGNTLANTLVFTSAEELRKKIDDYFEDCEAKHKIPTVTWLAVYLGTNRRTLLNYRNEIQSTLPEEIRHNISHELSRAMARLEAYSEDRLYDRDMANGAKFSLINNYGWADRQDIGLDSSGLEIRLSPDLDKYSK
jgi:hypothetical protein